MKLGVIIGLVFATLGLATSIKGVYDSDATGIFIGYTVYLCGVGLACYKGIPK